MGNKRRIMENLLRMWVRRMIAGNPLS